MFGIDFYPTPRELIETMIDKVDFKGVKHLLKALGVMKQHKEVHRCHHAMITTNAASAGSSNGSSRASIATTARFAGTVLLPTSKTITISRHKKNPSCEGYLQSPKTGLGLFVAAPTPIIGGRN